jgi:hypothetical protein
MSISANCCDVIKLNASLKPHAVDPGEQPIPVSSARRLRSQKPDSHG